MSGKFLEKVGFLRVIGKRSAMLTKLALRKPGGSEVRSRFLELLQPICREEASKVFSRLIRTFSRLEMQEQLNCTQQPQRMIMVSSESRAGRKMSAR